MIYSLEKWIFNYIYQNEHDLIQILELKIKVTIKCLKKKDK